MVGKKNKIASVYCSGGSTTCAGQNFNGGCKEAVDSNLKVEGACTWGCLGLGTCIKVCRFKAISINANGVAEIDKDKCTSCGLCISACPKGLIHMVLPEITITPLCSSQDSGAETRKLCKNGCVACKICVKNCPADAIYIENNHTIIDQDKCIACGMCVVKCPRGTIYDSNNIFNSI